MKIKIDTIERKPLVSKKTGKPFVMVNIMSGGQKYQAFADASNASWTEGQEIEAEVEFNPTYKTYTIKAPKVKPQVPQLVNSLEIMEKLNEILAILKTRGGVEEPPPPTDKDIPF